MESMDPMEQQDQARNVEAESESQHQQKELQVTTMESMEQEDQADRNVEAENESQHGQEKVGAMDSEDQAECVKADDEEEPQPKKLKRVATPYTEEEVNKITEKFWEITKRGKEHSETLLPSEFHTWGNKENIKGKSPTLKKLMELPDLENIDIESAFMGMMSELGLSVKTQPLHCDHPYILMAVEVQCSPQMWTFWASGDSEDEAVLKALKKGVQFFIKMAE